MNYLTKFFTSATKSPEKSKPDVDDMLERQMPEAMQEEMFCFTMGDCELYQLKPRLKKHTNPQICQIKECVF